MATDHRAEVEELLADYRRSREQLAGVQQELAAISEVARSEDGTVEVTVGAQGGLRDLLISENAYQRHRPAQLSALIVRLTAAASASAAARAAETLEPVLPAGTDPAGILDGRADLDPPEPPRNVVAPAHVQPVTTTTGHFEDEDDEDTADRHSWLEDSAQKRTRR